MSQSSLRLLIALLMALSLTILPLPAILSGFRPPWVLLLILYVQFFVPAYFSIIGVVILGLVLDILLSTVIGEHVFALVLCSWIAESKVRRFSFFPLGQQMTLVGFLCLTYQLAIILVDLLMGFQLGTIWSLGAAFFSVLFWPWLKILADDTILVKVKYYRGM